MSTHPFILQNDHEETNRPRQKSATAPAHRQPTDNNGNTTNANSGTNQPRTVSVRGRSASDLSRLDADCARQLYTIRHHDRQDRRGGDVIRGSNDPDHRTIRGYYVPPEAATRKRHPTATNTCSHPEYREDANETIQRGNTSTTRTIQGTKRRFPYPTWRNSKQ